MFTVDVDLSNNSKISKLLRHPIDEIFNVSTLAEAVKMTLIYSATNNSCV